MKYSAALSFFCGFVSLSLEILWVRLYGFSMLSTPVAFGFVLMAYLFGIAIGARFGGGACNSVLNNNKLWQRVIIALSISALLTVLMPFVFVWGQNQWWRNPVIDFIWIATVSGVLAYVFPIAHHIGAGASSLRQGRRFAWIYTSNVLGASLGPLVTGYILLHFFSVQQAFFTIAVLQIAAVGFFYFLQKGWALRTPVILGCFSTLILLGWAVRMLDPHILIQRVNANSQEASQVIENRHGIITIFPPDNLEKYIEGDDAVYGGNVYDGRTNLSLVKNTNGLDRPLLLAALQPEPKQVLMVGLSIGSWLALVNGFPGVEHVDVVEINPGYLEAMQSYPIQARALEDPRVNTIIDDARRWLRTHPGNTYDLIVMNTTWHWRANASFLLSREFMELIKAHMEPGAVMAFNSTGSPDAFYTATTVFAHAYRYGNFVFCADFDFRKRKESVEARNIYASIRVAGEPLFLQSEMLIEKYLSTRFDSIDYVQRISGRPLEVITDNNSVPEFKYGYPMSRLY